MNGPEIEFDWDKVLLPGTREVIHYGQETATL